MWPFKPKSAPKSALPRLIYESGEASFRSQCQYGFTDIIEGQGIVAIVLDTREEFGTEVAVKVQPSGCQLAAIRVASPDGGFRSFAETASPSGDRLKPGDLVVWVPMTHM